MTTTRKQYSPKFKARVAVEAIRGEKTLSQLGSQFKVHPIQIAKWRKSALEQLPELFVDGRTRKGRNGEADSDALYEEIGRLKVELDWLKKKSACSIEEMRPLVERGRPEISVRRQCELLGVNRSGLYYEPVGESKENLLLMRLLERRDALVAVDHQVAVAVVRGEDHDDGRLLARLSQRRHQAPLPVRLADSQVFPSPVELVKLQLHGGLRVQYGPSRNWSFAAAGGVCRKVSSDQ